MPKRVGKYEVGRTLGEGTFGKVKYAVNTETGERVALKILDKEKIQKQSMGASVKKEISIMKMVHHDCVTKLFEVLASRTKIFIVLELVTGGELFDKIVAEGRFNEDMARFYFRQLVRAVGFCHAQGVCHRDLKPENLLLDEHGNLKISDFGLSALSVGTGEDDDTSRATLLHTTCGTPNYVAPEVISEDSAGYDGFKADIWSCGVILYVLLAGFLPFDEPSMSALFKKIKRAEYVCPTWFTSDARDLLSKILTTDPKKRITIEGIRKHPWFLAGEDPDAVSTPLPDATGSASGGGGVKASPSAKDVHDAVAEASEDAEAAADEEDGPVALNAFDIINMLGGLAMNRLLVESEGDKKIKTIPTFISSTEPSALLKRAEDAMNTLHPDSVSVNSKAQSVTGEVLTPNGMVVIKVQLYNMTDDLRLVEIKKVRGDALKYSEIFAQIRMAMSDMASKTSARGFSVARDGAAAAGGGSSA